MSLDNIEIPVNCRIRYTEKMYYQKYIYKLKFEIDKSQLIKSKYSGRYYYSIEYSNKKKLIDELIDSLKKNITNHDYKIRRETFGIGLFTNNLKDIIQLINNPSRKLIEITRPLNDKHVDVIDTYRKAIVRKTLFNKEFKFKVYLKHDRELFENGYRPIRKFLEESIDKWNVNRILLLVFSGRNRYGYTKAVYLNSAEDLMMFQLKFNNYIYKIEEAILLSSLQS